MFDGINLNDRILRSWFDYASTTVARTVPGAEDARERMEIRNTSFLLKMVCYYEMIQSVEVVSNIQPNFFALNVRRDDPQPSIFVRSFSAITSVICKHGETQPGTTTMTLERDTTTIVFKNVPAEFCQTCGEAYLDAAATRHLLHI